MIENLFSGITANTVGGLANYLNPIFFLADKAFQPSVFHLGIHCSCDSGRVTISRSRSTFKLNMPIIIDFSVGLRCNSGKEDRG